MVVVTLQRLQEVSRDYVFFQKMRQYLEDLADCLSEKVPIIERCEDKLRQLREQCFAEFYRRRFQDWEDDFHVACGASWVSNSHPSVLLPVHLEREPSYALCGWDRLRPSNLRRAASEKLPAREEVAASAATKGMLSFL